MRCPDSEETAAVTTQQECQSNCAEDYECVGIVYSHTPSNTHTCVVCKNDNLVRAGNDFGFYRRPGNVHGYQFKLFLQTKFKSTTGVL